MKIYSLLIGLVPCTLATVNCTEDAVERELSVAKQESSSTSAALNGANSSSSVVDYSKSNYQGQLPYLNGEHGDIAEFRMENELDRKTVDPQYGWSYFDSLYEENLNKAQKQYLAYIILSKKDLLAEFNGSPTQTEADAILKYTNVLVETDYFGYCLLFNCLQTLQNQSFVSADINALKQNILANTTAKQYHEGSLQHFANFTNDPQSSKVYSKIKEDFDFLTEITNL